MRICLFDIDGTLISSGGAGKAAMEAALASEFGVTDPCQRVPYSGRTDRAIARDLLQAHGLDEEPHHWRRFLAAYLRHLPTTLVSHRGRVLPGIGALLDQLGARPDLVLGLLTGNIREGARLKLGHYELFHHFVVGGFGDHHFCRNDVAREALAAVRDHINGIPSPDRVWVIGDTPLDIHCARAINAKVAAVATGWHSPEELAAAKPDLLLKDFSDPEPLISALRN